MAKAIHTMIRVLDEKKSVDFYATAFALNIKDRFEFNGFTLIYLKNALNDFEVELTIRLSLIAMAQATATSPCLLMMWTRNIHDWLMRASIRPMSRNSIEKAR